MEVVMARDWGRIIRALEAKAADGACSSAEAHALRQKAAALRAEHGDPVPVQPAARRPLVWASATSTSSTVNQTTFYFRNVRT